MDGALRVLVNCWAFGMCGLVAGRLFSHESLSSDDGFSTSEFIGAVLGCSLALFFYWQDRSTKRKKEIAKSREEIVVSPPLKSQVVRCAYCGHYYPAGTMPYDDPALADHLAGCEKYPFRASAELIKRYRDALEFYADHDNWSWTEKGSTNLLVEGVGWKEAEEALQKKGI